MVNILLVSHSHKLAQGTAELVKQMAPSPELPLKIAAGFGHEHDEKYTNSFDIS